MALADFLLEAGRHVESCPASLCEIEPDGGNVAPEELPFDPDVLTECADFISVPLHNGLECPVEPVAQLQHERLVEVFLVLKELVQRPDGEFRLLGDLVHGNVVVALFRKKPQRDIENLMPLTQLFPFAPGQLTLFHSVSMCRLILFYEYSVKFYIIHSKSQAPTYWEPLGCLPDEPADRIINVEAKQGKGCWWGRLERHGDSLNES